MHDSIEYEAFPQKVYEAIECLRTQNQKRTDEHERGFTLPRPNALKTMLCSAFNATLSTEERRAIQFNLMYVPDLTMLERWHGSNSSPWFFSKLSARVELTAGGIRSIAPAVDSRESYLIVTPAEPNLLEDESDDLEIVGILTGANSLALANEGLSFHMWSGPPGFTISRRGAGQLSVSLGLHEYFRLQTGRLQILKDGSHEADRGQELYEFLYSEADNLEAEIVRASEDKSIETAAPRHFRACIHEIIRGVNRAGHGGTIIFVDSDYTVHDERLRDVISIKYKIDQDQLWRMLLRMWTNMFVRPADEGTNEFRGASFGSCQESVIEAIRFISKLAAVDGAVVLDKRLRVLGFGGEVTVRSSSLSTIDLVNADGSIERKPITEFGTRHRSAIRFVATVERSAAFVMSSDGGVRAFRLVGERVRMWPDIQYTAFGGS